MKPKKTFKYCEFCNAAIDNCSPPLEEYYEKGQIDIKDGTILLPEKITKTKAESIIEKATGLKIEEILENR